MPDDDGKGPEAQIAWARKYIQDRYGPQNEPVDPATVTVTCSGGIRLPRLAVRTTDGE